MTPPPLDPALVAAYRAALYRVFATPEFTLRIDEPSAPLARLHAAAGVQASAFVTACNPRGRPQSEADNAVRMQRLCAQLRQRGIAFVPGFGADPQQRWPGEPSVLALGLGPDEAGELGRAWAQNAIVCCGADATPRLVLLD